MASTATTAVSVQKAANLIYLIRGAKVMLDSDLAALYGIETRVLNQAVRRNRDRFPEDFMFQLSKEEAERVMLPEYVAPSGNSSQTVMSSRKHRGLTYRPFAFTEQGVAMLSSVLHSPRAVQVNIQIMRTFVRLRQLLASNAELAKRLDALENKYDAHFKAVFDAIRELMEPSAQAPLREIGFHTARKPQNGKSRSLAQSRLS